MSHGQKLTIPEQIEHMKNRGITFNIDSEAQAMQYLQDNNNYFKLRAYRKNYDKNGKGEYSKLDFAYLRDIAVIDMRLRYTLLKMCLDIEHSMRVKLIKSVVDDPNEDGYSVVTGFMTQDPQRYQDILDRASKSIYCADLQKKYANNMPVWALVEMMQFSSLCFFYRYVGSHLNDQNMQHDFYLLQEIRQVRNACAHSNCILNDLKSVHPAKYPPDPRMMNALSQIPTITKGVRQRKMSNDRIRQITTLLYSYRIFVTSSGLRSNRTKELRELIFDRYNRHADYYVSSAPISTTFTFFQKIIDNWYPDAV